MVRMYVCTLVNTKKQTKQTETNRYSNNEPGNKCGLFIQDLSISGNGKKMQTSRRRDHEFRVLLDRFSVALWWFKRIVWGEGREGKGSSPIQDILKRSPLSFFWRCSFIFLTSLTTSGRKKLLRRRNLVSRIAWGEVIPEQQNFLLVIGTLSTEYNAKNISISKLP